MNGEGNHSGSPRLASFVIGGLVGAGIAFLLAPRSGDETRKRITEVSRDVKGRAVCYYAGARGRMAAGVQDTKWFIQAAKPILCTAMEAGKEAYQREKERQSKMYGAVPEGADIPYSI